MHDSGSSTHAAAARPRPSRSWQAPTVTALGLVTQLTASGSGMLTESSLGQLCVMFPQFVQCMSRNMS